MYLGPDALKKAIDDAEFYPIQGLFHFSDYFHEIDAYYRQHYGYELGVSTGWKSVDEFYKVRLSYGNSYIILAFYQC